jgi:hypothetical protein
MTQTKLLTNLLAAIIPAEIPGVEWAMHDDLCDCTFQRIGEWTNPYIGKTLRVRFCCIWAELHKQYPNFVQELDGFFDHNTHRFVHEVRDWDGDFDMPRAIWYRHLASKTGKSLSEVRQEYADKEPPKGVRKVWPKPQSRTSSGGMVNLR